MAVDFFGAGVLFATPVFTSAGAAVVNPSPVQFGIIQDVEIDDEAEIKELYGANAYPVDIGRGKSKVSIKCKQAQFSAQLFNTVYYGQALTAGFNGVFAATQGQVIPTGAGATSIAITPTSPYGGTSTFAADLGVQDGNGVPYTRVTSSPTSGQYSLSGSTYTFSDVDVGRTVFINYQYANATNPAGSDNLIIYNQPMGLNPVFSAQFFVQRNGFAMWRDRKSVV